MNSRIKSFNNISELTVRERYGFSLFENVNKTLESISSLDNYTSIYAAYVQALLNIGEENRDQYSLTELDFQLQYLVEEKGITNQILSFAEAKYQTFDRALGNLLLNKQLLTQDEIGYYMEAINSIKQGLFEIVIYDSEGSHINMVEIPFDTQGDIDNQYAKFSTCLSSINIDKYIKEYSDIHIVCGIKKNKNF